MPVITLPSIATSIGDYELVRPLGAGGMGEVWLARHLTTGAEVVVKRLKPDQAHKANVRRLFQAEARTLMRFRHPNAVALLDASTDGDEQPYLVMEYLHGVTLHEVLEGEGRLPADRVGPILGDVCVVLQAAHDQGILHRDLTPANLMIVHPGTEHETVKVMDFGLARLGGGFYIALEKLQGDDGGIGGGTPDYVCPEQVRGEAVDGRGDLYSVGVLLYRALTGHLPFETAQGVGSILRAQRDLAPPAFAAFGVTDVPAAIERVVQSCLAKRPGERPPSARDLAERFGAALGVPIVNPVAFAVPCSAAVDDDFSFPADTLMDRFEAWLPESIAVMKLRGFVHGVGGEVIESLPGLIRVRLPNLAPPAAAPKRGFWSWLRATPQLPAPEIIELHLRKQSCGGRSQVEVAVVRPDAAAETRAARDAGRAACEQICGELRAYLMIGR